ncbi:MAG: TonB-dependent receptor [Candidatus Marinimicrobia bacterium]|nr:TonB-dependent receptor [Candidatus Neomarinimicrobiota bacterium]
MKTLKRLFMLILFFTMTAYAAEVKGYVIDAMSKHGISSASIYLKDIKTGTVSEKDGYFFLSTPESGTDTLIVEMIGYHKVKLALHFPQSNEMLIVLKQSVLEYGEMVTVSASRIQKSLRENSVSIDLITRELIDDAAAQNVAELLRSVPSLQIKDYGGIGNMKTISLRGASAAQVLVLKDGQRINNPQNGEVDLALISTEHIERIEIVRGGSSAIYGAEALGGVLHIITRQTDKNEPLKVSVKNTLASFQTYAFESSLSAAGEYIGIQTNYQYLRSKSDFTYTDRYGTKHIRLNNDIQRHHFFTRFNLTPGGMFANSKFVLSYNYLNSERGAPGTAEPSYLHARMEDIHHDMNLDMSIKSKDQRHTMRTNIYYSNHLNHYRNEDPADVLIAINDQYTTEAIGSELQFNSIFSSKLILNYGLSIRGDTFKHHRLELQYYRLNYDAYLTNESVFNFASPFIASLRITPALRYNGNSDFRDQWTPKLGIIMHLGQRGMLDLMANAGLSYRAPSFNDLYWPQDNFAVGNPDLEPEYGRDWDVGIRFQNKRLSLESRYFHNRMMNLIIWQDHAGIWWPENISEAHIQGIENALNIQVINNYFDISANYTFMDSRNLSEQVTENNKQLVYRPMHSGNIILRASYDNISLQFSTNINGKRYTDRSNTEIRALPPYTVSDLNLNYTWKWRDIALQCGAQIKNIFNTSYSIMKNLPMPGREYRMSLGLLFNKHKKEKK